MTQTYKTISTAKAPAAVGPYSQAVVVGQLVYTAGQLGLVPETGQLVEGGIEAQTRQVMHNLKNILDAAGSDLTSIVKTTIFITDMADFTKINEIYGDFFSNDPPARSTVQVAALPLGGKIEIEVVALVTK